MRILMTLLVVGLVLTASEAPAQTSDSTTPTITIFSPTAGATVTGTVMVEAYVNTGNTGGVDYLELFVDGTFVNRDISWPFAIAWDTRKTANGVHTLLVRAIRSFDTVIATQEMTVTVDQDLVAPTVSILSPSSGGTFSETMTIEASAADDRGLRAVRVQFDGQTTYNTLSGSPNVSGTVRINYLSNGPHTLTLQAEDPSGNVTVSEPVTFLVDNDHTAPSVAITSPANGAVVTGGRLTLQAEATDDRGIAKVVFLVDGKWFGEDTTAPYSVDWETDYSISADYTVTAQAYDLAGNVTTSAPVAVSVFHPGTAVYDPVLKAPVCDTVDSLCDTATLVRERNSLEPHAPNTLDGCADGPGLDDVYSERIHRIIVTRVGGEFLAENRRVRVDVLVSADTVGQDSLDLFVASDATNPVWTYVTSVPGVINGSYWISAEFVLPAGNLQAVRAQYQAVRTDPMVPCSTGWRDDHDDLVFAVGPPTDAFPPTVTLTNPYTTSFIRTVGGLVPMAATAEDDMAVTRVEFYADGVLIGTDTSAPYEASWNSATVADGSHSLTAKAYDPAGRSTVSKAVVVNTDNTAPTASLLSPTQGMLLRGVVTLDATASDPNGISEVEYYLDGTELGTYSTSPQTPYRRTWYTSYKQDGVHTLTARAVDRLGNVGSSAPLQVTIDNTPPSTEFTAPQAYASLRGTVQVSANATDAVGVAKVEFYAGDLLIGTATTAPYTVSWDSTTGPNDYVELKVRAYDTAGNVSGGAYPVSLPVYVDNSAPTVAITSPANGASLFLTTTVQATASDNVGVTQVVFYDGTKVIGTDTTSPYSVSWSLLSVTKGSHTLTAKAYDAVGNVTTSAPITVKVN